MKTFPAEHKISPPSLSILSVCAPEASSYHITTCVSRTLVQHLLPNYLCLTFRAQCENSLIVSDSGLHFTLQNAAQTFKHEDFSLNKLLITAY